MKRFLSLLCICVLSIPGFGQKLPSKKIAEELLHPQQAVKNLPVRWTVPAALRQAVRAAEPAIHSVRKVPFADAAGEGKPLLSPEASARLERLAAQRASEERAKAPLTPLQETEKHIRQSLVEIVGRSSGELMGSGFVVRGGSGQLYAVAAYHVVGHAGNALAIRMYDEQGKAVFYPCVIVSASGSYGINAPDAAIIALPARAARHAKPLKVAYGLPQANSELVAWGIPYTVDEMVRMDELSVKHAGGFKIVMETQNDLEHLKGLCGSPLLDAQGKVAGIYSGHDAARGLVYAVNARKALEWLIGNYENRTQAMLTFKLYGRTVFTLKAGETVGRVRHLDELGRPLHMVYLPNYPEPFEPDHLEGLFPDLKPGERLEFEVIKHRFVDRIISVEIL